MRKIVFIFIALIAIGQNVCAQGMTATLQSGDDLSVFYGVSAFANAYAEAKDGDQITLSAGTFNAPIESITKSVKITGVGAYETTGNTVFENHLTLSGTDIRIEGIKFPNVLYVSNSVNLIVTRCWIEKLDASSNYTNPLFNECTIKSPTNFIYARSFTIKNCTIKQFSGGNNSDETNVGNILNTVIYEWDGAIGGAPYAIYRNCLMGHSYYNGFNSYLQLKKPSEFYYNIGFTTDKYAISFKVVGECINVNNQILKYEDLFNKTMTFPAKPQNAPTGDDGTVVGPYGGTGFSQYPAIPRIISKDIDGKTNDEGQINVKIEVKAEN
jgi:hypothetical protein